MKIKLGKSEIECLKSFIQCKIPDYIKKYSTDDIDMMYNNEEMFMFSHELLKVGVIDKRKSPWGDGCCVIFDSIHYNVLNDIIRANISDEVNSYCKLCLTALTILDKYSL